MLRLLNGATELCNASFRSSALLEGLGWSQPLAGTIIAAQLLALGRMHVAGSASAEAVENGTGNAAHANTRSISSELGAEAAGATTAISQMLAQLIPQLYRALDRLPAAHFATAAAVVSGAPIVWVGNGFAQTDRVALRCGYAGCCHLLFIEQYGGLNHAQVENREVKRGWTTL